MFDDDAPTSYVRTASGHMLAITSNWNTEPLTMATKGLITIEIDAMVTTVIQEYD